MHKFIPDNPRVLVQGITGKEASRALPGMLEYGTNVVAGVTPGRGGQVVEGIPVFNTAKEAIAAKGPINMVVQFVPALHTWRATEEVLSAGVPFVLVGAEKVPVHDALRMLALAKKNDAMLIGPGSVGMIVPNMKLKIGMVGGDKPSRTFSPGNIAVLSKSGGMTSEIASLLKQHGRGVSLAAGLGGERITGSDFADILMLLEDDANTKASVIFGELGGFAEEKVAEAVASGHIRKPIVSFTVGEFVSALPHSVPFGHTGAILLGSRGGVIEKRVALRKAGVLVAERFDDIPSLLGSTLP